MNKHYVTRNGALLATTIDRDSIDAALSELRVVYSADPEQAARMGGWAMFAPEEECPEFDNDALRTAYLAGYMDGRAGRFEHLPPFPTGKPVTHG